MFPEAAKVVVVALTIVVPIFVIYRRAGFHPAWGLLVFLPGFGLLIIFMQLGLLDWPNSLQDRESK